MAFSKTIKYIRSIRQVKLQDMTVTTKKNFIEPNHSFTFVLDVSVEIFLCAGVLENLLDLWVRQTLTCIAIIVIDVKKVQIKIKKR